MNSINLNCSIENSLEYAHKHMSEGFEAIAEGLDSVFEVLNIP